MSNSIFNQLIKDQEFKLSKIKALYQEKINEGTCFAKSIALEIEQQLKAKMSIEEIFNYWFK